MDYQADKYFVPQIEDIRVGYECELNDGGWRTIRISKHYLPRALVKLHNDNIRTPYLTKEQIEAEGWNYDENIKAYRKDITEDYWVEARYKTNYLLIITCHKTKTSALDNPSPSFNGHCKDINTFRYICKLLNIE